MKHLLESGEGRSRLDGGDPLPAPCRLIPTPLKPLSSLRVEPHWKGWVAILEVKQSGLGVGEPIHHDDPSAPSQYPPVSHAGQPGPKTKIETVHGDAQGPNGPLACANAPDQ